jgi:hypothetical protein
MNLRDTLKDATAGEHAALERTGVLRAFSSDCISPAVYTDYLARQWHLHSVMEPVLQGWLGAGWADAHDTTTVEIITDVNEPKVDEPKVEVVQIKKKRGRPFKNPVDPVVQSKKKQPKKKCLFCSDLQKNFEKVSEKYTILVNRISNLVIMDD